MKPFQVVILCCVEHIQGIHDFAKYLPPLFMKVKSSDSASWDVRNN